MYHIVNRKRTRKYVIVLALFVIGLMMDRPTFSQQTENGADDPVRATMLEIGMAMERFYQDKGVFLVDLIDGETPEGRERLETVLENVGNPTDRPRTMRDVLLPLVHFGYLDAIPDDPYLPANAPSVEGLGEIQEEIWIIL